MSTTVIAAPANPQATPVPDLTRRPLPVMQHVGPAAPGGLHRRGRVRDLRPLPAHLPQEGAVDPPDPVSAETWTGGQA